MKFNRILEISLHRVLRNKKINLIIVVPVILIVVSMLIVNTIQYSTKQYIGKIKENIKLRTIDGIIYTESQYNQIIEKLQKIEHIEMIIDMYERQIYADEYCENLKTENTNGYTYIQPVNEQICPEVIKGRKITEEDKYAIIIPNKICANGTTNDEYSNVVLEKQNIKEMYIDGENLIGNTITIEFQKNNELICQKAFEIIGVYDSDKYSDTETLYTSKDTIKEINKEMSYIPEDLIIEVVVDDINNILEVENNLYESGLKNESKIQSEIKKNKSNTLEEKNIAFVTNIHIETQDMIKKLLLFFIVASILILVVFLITSNVNKSYLSTREIGILKVEGYTNKEIQKLAIMENIIVCLISIIISLIIFEIIKLSANVFGNYIIEKDIVGITMNKIKRQIYYIKKIPQQVNLIFLVVMSIIIIVIESLNTFFINRRILSKNIKEILK